MAAYRALRRSPVGLPSAWAWRIFSTISAISGGASTDFFASPKASGAFAAFANSSALDTIFAMP